jgi:hypothetical protein
MTVSSTCAHLRAITTVTHEKRHVCEECINHDGRHPGASTHLPDLRRDPVLRQLAEPSWDSSRPGHRTSGKRLGGAG